LLEYTGGVSGECTVCVVIVCGYPDVKFDQYINQLSFIIMIWM